MPVPVERELEGISEHPSDSRLQEAARVAGVGIFDHDHVTDTIYWSPEQRAIYGVGADEEITLPVFLGLVHPEDAPRIGLAVQTAHDPGGDGRFDVQHRIVRRDGDVRWIDTRSQTYFAGDDQGARAVRTVGAVIDISDYRRAEELLSRQSEELRVSEERIRSLLEATPLLAAIYEPTEEGRLVFANDALAAIIGIERDEIEGHVWADISRHFPDGEAFREALLAGNLVESIEGRIYDVRGGERLVAWASTRLPVAPGEPELVAGLGMDITTQRRAETARAQAERDRVALMEALLTAEESERRRLAEALHDDTIQEITAGLFAIDAARRAGGDGEALERARAIVAGALERARRVLFELSPPALERVGLSGAVTEFCQQIAADGGFDVTVETPGGRYPSGVEQLCYRTIREATMNVRKHARARTAQVSLQQVGDRLVGVVADDGIGFDPSQDGRNRRTVHLGIDAMAGRIRASGGEFDLQSSPGTGTRVTFQVPIELVR